MPNATAASIPAFPTFSPAELRSDLDYLIATMIDVGVYPFIYTGRSMFEAAAARIRLGLSHPMDAFTFYGRVAPLFTSLNDGHLSIGMSDAYKRYRDAGGAAFPLQVDLRASGAYAAETDIPAIPAESRLLAIDGVPMADVMDSALALVSGQSRSLRLAFADENVVRSYLLAAHGRRASFAVRVRRPDGSVATVNASATTRAELTKHQPPSPTTSEANYTFSRIENGRVGYIDYLACDDLDAFKTFLRTTFADIASNPIDGLVIDIRKNGGGNSALNDILWSYVTDRPFAQFGGGAQRSSAFLKRAYGEAKYVAIYSGDAWSAKDGALITIDPDPPLAHGTYPNNYKGPVYLLIGVGTFSSAMSCATAAKDFGLATLVGEETAEPVNSNGEVYYGVAPITKLAYGFPTKYFEGPKPRPVGQGVVPDVTIHTTEADFASKRDPVLDYAVAQIIKKRV